MSTEFEKMVNGDFYDPADPDLVQRRRQAKVLCRQFNLTEPHERLTRQKALKALLAAGAKTAQIEPPFFCDYGSQIHFGKGCFLNTQCVILDVCRVILGDHCLLGPGVHLYTASHPLNAQQRRISEFGRPITLGQDVWLGGGVIVCPGVTIGDRAVIGAGSVVTRDIPADVVAVGNPCRVLRPLTEQDRSPFSQ